MITREHINYKESQRDKLAVLATKASRKTVKPFREWIQDAESQYIKYGNQKTLGIPRVPDPYDIDLPF